MDNSSLLRLDPDEKLNLDEQDSIVLNSSSTLPKTIIKLPTKLYVDQKFNLTSIIRHTAHVHFNDENLDNIRCGKKISLPAVPVREHLTPKFYADEAISHWVVESSLLGLDPDEKLNLDEQDSIILNSTLTSSKTIIELPTQSYVDTLQENRKNRQDLSSVFNDQDNELGY